MVFHVEVNFSGFPFVTNLREAFAAAHPEPGKRPDYERPLTDAERLAIIDKADEILGIK